MLERDFKTFRYQDYQTMKPQPLLPIIQKNGRDSNILEIDTIDQLFVGKGNSFIKQSKGYKRRNLKSIKRTKALLTQVAEDSISFDRKTLLKPKNHANKDDGFLTDLIQKTIKIDSKTNSRGKSLPPIQSFDKETQIKITQYVPSNKRQQSQTIDYIYII